MALTGSFTDLLMTAKRRAQLSGRPLTGRETAGIAKGYAATATDRLVRMKTLEERKRRTDLEVEAAEKAEEREKRGTIGAVAGAGIGYALAPAGVAAAPYVVGGLLVGEMIGGTWLCTETHKQTRFTEDQSKTLDEVRAYAKEHHSGWLEFYVRIGPEIVKAINETEGSSFYDDLKENMIEPVIAFFDNDRKEDAFIAYKLCVIALIQEYTPHHIEEAEAVDKVDLGLKEAA